MCSDECLTSKVGSSAPLARKGCFRSMPKPPTEPTGLVRGSVGIPPPPYAASEIRQSWGHIKAPVNAFWTLIVYSFGGGARRLPKLSRSPDGGYLVDEIADVSFDFVPR